MLTAAKSTFKIIVFLSNIAATIADIEERFTINVIFHQFKALLNLTALASICGLWTVLA